MCRCAYACVAGENHDVTLHYMCKGLISLEEFLQRNTTAMAVFIRHIRQEQPHTKGRHSQQTWLDEESSRDPVLQSIQRRSVIRLTTLPNRRKIISKHLVPKDHYFEYWYGIRFCSKIRWFLLNQREKTSSESSKEEMIESKGSSSNSDGAINRILARY